MSAHQPRHHYLTVYRYATQEASSMRLDIWYARDAEEAREMLRRTGADYAVVSVYQMESPEAYRVLRDVFRAGYIATLRKRILHYSHWSFAYGATT